MEQELAAKDVASRATVRVVGSENTRLDTGKWCVGLEALSERVRHHARWIVLANDSIYLLHALPKLFVALATGRYDMVGPVAVSAGWDTPPDESYHVQSFLRAFTRRALRRWQNRSCALPPSHESFRSKRDIVVFHEIGSSQMYGRGRIFGLYNGDSTAPGNGGPVIASSIPGKPWHLNFSFWNDSWPRGFPVAKRPQLAAVCDENVDELMGWKAGRDRGAGGLAECLAARFGRC